jgi:ribosomal protein S18 acetylase RimI-like enzyme
MEQSIVIQPMQPAQASSVTDIHMLSQEGTFLTSLGRNFLTALYDQISQSKYSFSYTALSGDTVVGFIVGTSYTGALFKDVISKRPFRLGWLICQRALSRPIILWQSLKTLSYPNQLPANTPAAELLALAVNPAWRNRQIGSRLVEQLIQDLTTAHIDEMVVTVDGQNEGALRFYQRHGFKVHHQTDMYGRPMIHLTLTIKSGLSGSQNNK